MSLMDNIRKLMLDRAAQGIGTGGGLFGTTNQQGQPQGLLGGLQNINPNLLIGASIAGAGLKGSDPFSSIFPAVAGAAQLQKYMTPETGTTKLVYDKKLEEQVYRTDKQIQLNPDRYGAKPEESEVSKVRRSQENTFFSSYTKDKAVQAFNESSTQLKKMLSAFEQGTGAGDVAGVFAFMKTLDPNSVVRESEFEVAEGTGGAKLGSFEKAFQTWRKLKTGERLTEREKENFKKAGIGFYQGDQSTIDNIRSGYYQIAQNQGLDPTNIIVDSDLRPFTGEVPIPIDPNNPESGTKEIKFNSSLGMQLVDYKDGEYYFRLPNGELFKTKGIR
jgi:hypothetical protein